MSSISQKIPVKPLSVNSAFKGRRFKTKMYTDYEKAVLYLLDQKTVPKKPYELYYKFGLSSRMADLGNQEKLITDILCKKYFFDDRYIDRIVLEKEIVSKGNEYIYFELKTKI